MKLDKQKTKQKCKQNSKEKLNKKEDLRSWIQFKLSLSSLSPLGHAHAVFAEFAVICGAGKQTCEHRPFRGKQWFWASGCR